jgi:hypothetical protein
VPKSLSGLPRMRAIPDPTALEPLSEFSCGGSSEYETAVDRAVDELLQMSSEDLAEYDVRVAEDAATGALIGVSVAQERRLNESTDHFARSMYLAVLAINQPYRGWRMPDGATRIGTFLLGDALAEIGRTWEEPMPYVWAVVHRENRDCQRLLSNQSFWRINDINRDPSNPYFVHFRDEGIDWSDGLGPHVIRAVSQARGE